MSGFFPIDSVSPFSYRSMSGMHPGCASYNTTPFGFSPPELDSMNVPFLPPESQQNPWMTQERRSISIPLQMLGTMRSCRAGEKFVVGEMVGMQSSPYVPCYPVQVSRIYGRGIEFVDPRTGLRHHLPFCSFFKIEPFPSAAPSPIPSPSVTVPTPQPTPPLDCAKTLVREFEQREFVPQQLQKDVAFYVFGYRSTEEQSVRDKQRLVRILTAHNVQFAARILSETDSVTNIGMTEKLRLPSGTEIFVRADLHSDLASLLEQLNLLQKLRYLDENYSCRPGFSMIFLGDYVDRGVNDIAVLSLLLSLRMENPTSVHLLRGNHENIDISSFYSSDAPFLRENQRLFQDCFASFPMSLSIATVEPYIKPTGESKHQYVHFSHGLFSPSELGESFSKGVVGLSLVPKIQKFGGLNNASEKAHSAFFQVASKFHDVPHALDGQGYMWSDIDRVAGPSVRGCGYNFSPDDIRLSLRSADLRIADDYNEICACFRGHEHAFQEHEVTRKVGGRYGTYKVIATTLPVAMSTRFFEQDMQLQQIQGFMMKISPKAGDWAKVPMLLDMDDRTDLPKLRLHERSYRLYERVEKELNAKVEERGEFKGIDTTTELEGAIPIAKEETSLIEDASALPAAS